MTMNHINHLPADCLRHIFDFFDLQEQIRLRLVCSHWKTFIETDLFAPKRSLKLFTSIVDFAEHHQEILNYNVADATDFCIAPYGAHLIVCSQEVKSLHFLTHLFPNITALLFSAKALPEEQQPFLINLSKAWPSLTSFTLLAPPWTIGPELYTHLKHIKSLNFFYMVRQTIPRYLGPHLEELCITHYVNNPTDILQSLGPSIRKLLLGWVHLDAISFENLLKSDKHYLRQLTSLHIGYVYTNAQNRVQNFYQILKVICRYLTQISVFCIMFADTLPLVQLIPQLGKLTHLHELWLYLSANQLPRSTSAASALHPLSSVIILNLELHQITADTFIKSIAPLFPNIRKLTLRSDQVENDAARIELEQQCNRVFERLERFKLRH